ncbi:MAG: type II toxin-antitoxin system HipA family toxin [Gammaproteobacteria bacterium]|nr:type II toxin-antitoxin system HipA family toxin [Gammaproteobacteria bacterium]
MNGLYVGVWVRNKNKANTFSYDADYLKSPYRRPLSISLPFLADGYAHKGDVVDNFFSNLLPDNEKILDRLQAKFSTSSKKSFDLLSAIGRDCVGAIQLLPEGANPIDWDIIKAKPLSDKDVENILSNTITSSVGALTDDTDFRISIAGAQEKTALLWHNEQWHLPESSTPTTHIFKLPLGKVGNMDADFKTSIENEWLCSEIVSAYGINTAKTEIVKFGKQKVLVVERFDRKLNSKKTHWLRLPQEDFCQALGFPPNFKYEKDGGPGIAEILNLLNGSKSAEEDRATFFKAQIVFWMLAAIDGHAKNFSIFHLPEHSFKLTPLYDILSAWPIIGGGANQLAIQKAKMGMSVKSKSKHYKINNIQRRHFNAMAKQCGLGQDAEKIIKEILQQTEDVICNIEKSLPQKFPKKVSSSIFKGLRQSAKKLKKMPRD